MTLTDPQLKELAALANNPEACQELYVLPAVIGPSSQTINTVPPNKYV